MARVKPSRQIRIAEDILKRIEERMASELRRESVGSYIETILDQFVQGRFVNKHDVAEIRSLFDGKVHDVQAITVRKAEPGDQRKAI